MPTREQTAYINQSVKTIDDLLKRRLMLFNGTSPYVLKSRILTLERYPNKESEKERKMLTAIYNHDHEISNRYMLQWSMILNDLRENGCYTAGSDKIRKLASYKAYIKQGNPKWF